MASIEIILLLLFAAVILVGIAQKFRVPYPIALVLGGAAIGFIPNLPNISFNSEIVLVIVLPPILYYAAFGTVFQEFQRNWRDIFSLALGLVIFTTLIIGVIFKWLFPQFPWALAFAFGAIVSPPDAISTTAILKRFSLSPRLISLLEGESLINDASALVLYKLAITALLSGSFSLMEGEWDFVIEVLGGVIIGLISGFVLQLFSRKYLEPVLGILFSFTIPYTTYIIAMYFGVSGVIAVVVNGLVGAHILFTHHSSLRRVVGYGAWDIFVILLNCFVFILMGMQLKNIVSTMNMEQIMLYLEYAILITISMTIIRFIWVYGKAGISYVKALYRPNSNKVCNQILREAAIIGWSGMRGIVSLSVAIALPPVEGRNEVIFITFVVILITLLVPGMTLPWLIRWLHIGSHVEHHEMHQVRKQLSKITEERLDHYLKINKIDKNEFDFLLTYFSSQHRVLEMSHDEEMQNMEKVRHEIIQFQRDLLIDLWKHKQIDENILRHLTQELDLIELHIARAELK